LTDGLGVATFFLAISGHYDSSALPSLKPLPWYKRLTILILTPFLLIRAILSMLTTLKNSNAIKKSIPMTGIRNGAFLMDLDLSKIKAYCKE
jgi:hypothetical protein